MALFEDQAEDDLARAVTLVEQTIAALGIDPETSRLPADAGARFALRRGSAAVVIAVHPAVPGAEGGSIRVVAPVVRLPAEERRPALYRRLLEANATEVMGAAFAVVDPDVVLVVERSLRDLDASEVDAMIKTVGRVADRYDDALAQEFGTARSSDGP